MLIKLFDVAPVAAGSAVRLAIVGETFADVADGGVVAALAPGTAGVVPAVPPGGDVAVAVLGVAGAVVPVAPAAATDGGAVCAAAV